MREFGEEGSVNEEGGIVTNDHP